MHVVRSIKIKLAFAFKKANLTDKSYGTNFFLGDVQNLKIILIMYIYFFYILYLLYIYIPYIRQVEKNHD